MLKPLQQSLFTYWVHSRSSFIGSGTFWAGVTFCVLMFLPRRASVLAALVIALPTAVLWLHFREQVLHPLRRLSPRFAGPQLIAFLVLLAVLNLAYPVLFALRHGYAPLGVITLCLVACALIGWWMLTLSPMLTIAITIGFFTITSASVLMAIDRVAYAWDAQRVWLLLIASVVAIGMAIVWMLRLTEEHKWFKRSVQLRTNLRERMTGETSNVWAQSNKQFSVWPTRVPASYPAPAEMSARDRYRRWRAISPGNVKMMFIMSAMLTISFGLPVYRNNNTGPMSSAAMLWFVWLIMMPAMTSGQAWLRLWRFMEAELLKPTARATFLRDIGVIMVIDTARAWAILAGGMATSFVIFPGSMKGRLVVELLCASALAQPLMFGLAVWYMRYRSVGRLTVSATTAMVVIIPVAMFLGFQALADFHGVVLGFCMIFCLAGVVLTRNACRRWLAVELG